MIFAKYEIINFGKRRDIAWKRGEKIVEEANKNIYKNISHTCSSHQKGAVTEYQKYKKSTQICERTTELVWRSKR